VAAPSQRREDPTTAERGDEDALDPVETADAEDGDEIEDAGLAELEDAFDDEVDDDVAAPDDEESLEVPLEEGLEDGEEDVVVPAVPAEAAFDDEDEASVVAAVVSDDDDDDGAEIDGLRAEEFVCRSCYMAKRDSQLADPERMLCRDCA
jgi:hypothetical protein